MMERRTVFYTTNRSVSKPEVGYVPYVQQQSFPNSTFTKRPVDQYKHSTLWRCGIPDVTVHTDKGAIVEKRFKPIALQSKKAKVSGEIITGGKVRRDYSSQQDVAPSTSNKLSSEKIRLQTDLDVKEFPASQLKQSKQSLIQKFLTSPLLKRAKSRSNSRRLNEEYGKGNVSKCDNITDAKCSKLLLNRLSKSKCTSYLKGYVKCKSDEKNVTKYDDADKYSSFLSKEDIFYRNKHVNYTDKAKLFSSNTDNYFPSDNCDELLNKRTATFYCSLPSVLSQSQSPVLPPKYSPNKNPATASTYRSSLENTLFYSEQPVTLYNPAGFTSGKRTHHSRHSGYFVKRKHYSESCTSSEGGSSDTDLQTSPTNCIDRVINENLTCDNTVLGSDGTILKNNNNHGCAPTDFGINYVTNVTDLTSEIRNVTSNVTNLTGDVRHITTNVTSVTENVTHLKNEVTNITADVTNLISDIRNLNDDIITQEHNIKDNEEVVNVELECSTVPFVPVHVGTFNGDPSIHSNDGNNSHQRQLKTNLNKNDDKTIHVIKSVANRLKSDESEVSRGQNKDICAKDRCNSSSLLSKVKSNFEEGNTPVSYNVATCSLDCDGVTQLCKHQLCSVNQFVNIDHEKEKVTSSGSSFDQISLSELDRKSPVENVTKLVKDSVRSATSVLKSLPETKAKCGQCFAPVSPGCQKTLLSIEKPLKAIKVYLDKLFNKFQAIDKCSQNNLCTNSDNPTVIGQTDTTGIPCSSKCDHPQLLENLSTNGPFDHSDQTFEYQLDNGNWTDSRNSLKTLYDEVMGESEVEICIDGDAILRRGLNMEQDLDENGLYGPDRELHKKRMMERKRKSDSDSMNRRESVREWLETLADVESGLGDMEKGAADPEPDLKQDHNANFEDDLFLGAEAKLIRTSGSKKDSKLNLVCDKENIQHKEENQDKLSRLNRSATLDQPSTGPPAGVLPYRRLSLQKRFQFYHTDSFQSNDSTKTYSSVNEILHERSGNPVEILSNLGFGATNESDNLANRIPTRFLKCKSKAEGIVVEQFLDQHPQIKENLLREESLGQPVLLRESFTPTGLPSSGESPVESVSDVPHPPPTRKNSLFSAARNVILMNRFASTIPYSQTEGGNNTTLHEGITPQGKVFQSILHPDNTEFFANQGLYDESSEKKVKKSQSPLVKEASDFLKKSLECEETIGINFKVSNTTLEKSEIKGIETKVEESAQSKASVDDDNAHPGNKQNLFDRLLSMDIANGEAINNNYKDFSQAEEAFPHNFEDSSQIKETDTMLAFSGLSQGLNSGEGERYKSDFYEENQMLCDDKGIISAADVFSKQTLENSVGIGSDLFGSNTGDRDLNEHLPYGNPLCNNTEPDQNESCDTINGGTNHLNITEGDNQNYYQDNYQMLSGELVSNFNFDNLEIPGNLHLGLSKSNQNLHTDLFSDNIYPDKFDDRMEYSSPHRSRYNTHRTKYSRSHSLFPPTVSTQQEHITEQSTTPTVTRRDRLIGARKNWHSSSNFKQTVDDTPAATTYSTSFQSYDFPHSPITISRDPMSGRLFPSHSMSSLHEIDKISDAGSGDYGESGGSSSSSYLDRLQKLKDKHESNRDYHIENTLGQVEKVKQEISRDPNKLDDPKFVQKLQKKYSKGPSYMDKLKNLKAIHERKQREIHSGVAVRHPIYESQEDDFVIGHRKPSLFDLLSEEMGNEESNQPNNVEEEECENDSKYEDTLTGGETLWSQLSQCDTEVFDGITAEAGGDKNQELPVGIQDIVLLQGLTDDVLDIIKDHRVEHCGSLTSPSEEQEGDNDDMYETVTDEGMLSAMVNLLCNTDFNDKEVSSQDDDSFHDAVDIVESSKQEEMVSKDVDDAANSQEVVEVVTDAVSEVVLNHEEKRLKLQEQGKNAESFEMEEIHSTDIEADSDTVSSDLPTIKPPRGPLLRAGSAQSDSSGFADSTDSHSVAEIHWDGLKLKNSESGIETASNVTLNDTLVSSQPKETFSRQSSSTSSNTVTEITPQIKGDDVTKSNATYIKTEMNQSGESSQDNYTKQDEFVDDSNRKVKITSSRGHPHSKGTGDYLVNRPGIPLVGHNTDELYNAVEELEIDLYSDEVLSCNPSGDNSLQDLIKQKSIEKPNQDNAVEELEINLYDHVHDGDLQKDITVVGNELDLSPRIRLAKSREDIFHDLESEYQERAIDVGPVPSEPPKKKLGKKRDDIITKQEADLNKQGAGFHEEEIILDNEIIHESDDLTPRKRLAKSREGIMNEKQPEVCEQKESLKKKIVTSFENIIHGVRKESVQSSLDDDEVKTENNNEYQEVNLEISKPKQSVDIIPQTETKELTLEINRHIESIDTNSEYKEYEFPKVRMAERRKMEKKIKKPIKSEPPPQAETPKTGKQISEQVQLSYRQHFMVSEDGNDDEEEISEYRMVLGDNLTDKEKTLKLPEAEQVKKIEPKKSHHKVKPEKHGDKNEKGVSDGDQSVETVTNDTLESYLILSDIEVTEEDEKAKPQIDIHEKEEKVEETSKKKGWFPWSQEKHKGEESKSHAVIREEDIGPDEMPESLPKKQKHKDKERKEQKKTFKKSWFTGKRVDSNDSVKESKKDKNTDGLADALKKNSDVVFKATLSPFRRIWSPEEQQAESVEEPSLNRQMLKSFDDDETVPLGHITYKVYSSNEDVSANEMSLAEEFDSYNSEVDSVHEHDIAPVIANGKEIKPEFKEQSKGPNQRAEACEDLTRLLNTDDIEVSDSDAESATEEVTEDVINVTNTDPKLEYERKPSMDKLSPENKVNGDCTKYEDNQVFNHIEEKVSPDHLEDFQMEVIQNDEVPQTMADVEREFESLRNLLSTSEEKPDVISKFVNNEIIPDEVSQESSVSYNDSEDGQVFDEQGQEYLSGDQSKHVADTDQYSQEKVIHIECKPPNENTYDYEQTSVMNEQGSIDEASDQTSDITLENNDNLYLTYLNDNEQYVGKNGQIDIFEDPIVTNRRNQAPLRSDSVLDKFFDNPNFQSHSESEDDSNSSHSNHSNQFENPNFVNEESEGQSSQDSGNEDIIDVGTVTVNTLRLDPIGKKKSSQDLVEDIVTEKQKVKGKKSLKSGSSNDNEYDRTTSSESDVFVVPDVKTKDSHSESLVSIENARKSGSEMDDKCVGTDLDLSGYSLDSERTRDSMRSSVTSPLEYSQRMVVSKLSLEPQKPIVPVNDIAEVVLIIDNGVIKAVHNVETESVRKPRSSSMPGKYESYVVNPTNDERYYERYRSDPDYPETFAKDYGAYPTSTPHFDAGEIRPGRMSRDSGYNSNFTSMSESQFPEKHMHQTNSLNLKVSPTQQGASYIPVIKDHSVRSKGFDVFGQHLHHEEGMHDSSWSVASGSSDVSEHQVLCTMLKQSEYYGPQIEGILQKSQWPLFSRTRACTKQNLVEEVKLMQHALQKYKMEFKALEIRSRNVYKDNLQHLTDEEREALENLEEIRDEILNEIIDLEKGLAVRMKNIIAGHDLLSDQGPMDLASIQVISQMIEVLKEQVYHSNIVNSMCNPETSPTHPLLVQLENSSEDHSETISTMKRSNSLLDHLSLLQSQMQAQQSQQTAVLNSSLKELKSVLLDEIRDSIHSETQELKYKLENTETQLHELKQHISRSGTPHDLSHELLLVDMDLNQNHHDVEDETF